MDRARDVKGKETMKTALVIGVAAVAGAALTFGLLKVPAVKAMVL